MGSEIDDNDNSQNSHSGVFSSFEREQNRKLSEVSGHADLSIDYFDPPLLDYMPLFEEGEVDYQDQIVINDSAAKPVFYDEE